MAPGSLRPGPRGLPWAEPVSRERSSSGPGLANGPCVPRRGNSKGNIITKFKPILICFRDFPFIYQICYNGLDSDRFCAPEHICELCVFIVFLDFHFSWKSVGWDPGPRPKEPNIPGTLAMGRAKGGACHGPSLCPTKGQ